jgi:hypothetical protein
MAGLDSGQSHSLYVRSIRKRHTTNHSGIDTDCQLSLTSVGRNGTGVAFVAQSSQPGQDSTEDRFRQCNLDGFCRFRSPGANATMAGLPVELKFAFLAEFEQILDKPDHGALCGPKAVGSQFQGWWGVTRGCVKSCRRLFSRASSGAGA